MTADNKISRRDFLRIAGVTAAGTALAACAGGGPKPPDSTPSAVLRGIYPEVNVSSLRQMISIETERSFSNVYNFAELQVVPEAFKETVKYNEMLSQKGNRYIYNIGGERVNFGIISNEANSHYVIISPSDFPRPYWITIDVGTDLHNDGFPPRTFIRIPENLNNFPDTVYNHTIAREVSTSLAIEMFHSTCKVDTFNKEQNFPIQEGLANSLGILYVLKQLGVSTEMAEEYSSKIKFIYPRTKEGVAETLQLDLFFDRQMYDAISRVGLPIRE